MARTRRIKLDGDAHYHLMSRTNDRRFLFENGKVKTELVDALRRAAEFSGVVVKAYAAMSNHFHVVVKVIKSEDPIGVDELLRRVGVLKGEKARQKLSERWEGLRKSGMEAALQEEQERLRARMNDISEFIKTFKEEFGRAFKKDREYCGSIWSGRFYSTLIQDGEYLRKCMRYVIYNPVRAGMVTRAADYRWSWCESDGDTFAGPVPGEWCLRRVAQMGAGKVYGSVEFVMEQATRLGSKFKTGGVGAHPVGEIGYSTHGWKLAEKAA